MLKWWLLLLLGACSGGDDHPPMLGDCFTCDQAPISFGGSGGPPDASVGIDVNQDVGVGNFDAITSVDVGVANLDAPFPF